MRNVLRYMPLVCLLASTLTLNAQPRNPYDLELQNLRAQWTSASHLQKLVFLAQISHLRDFVDDRSQVTAALENIRQSRTEDDLIKNEAAAYLDDLRAFSTPLQPRARHWFAVETERKNVLTEAQKKFRRRQRLCNSG